MYANLSGTTVQVQHGDFHYYHKLVQCNIVVTTDFLFFEKKDF